MKIKYYSLKEILSKNCQYNMIIGERSNGKTYSALKYGINKYATNGEQFAIIRRWQDDFKGKRSDSMFDSLISNDEIFKATKGLWTNVSYYSGRWYLSRMDEDTNKMIKDDTPFAYGFSISAMEHDKSTSYPNITTIIYDEFLTRGMYLPDEFVLFMNVLSTIIRERDNVKIFMLGNTVNKYSPYFLEMGLNNISKMKPGDIDIYTYGEGKLQVAVEYADNLTKNKPSNMYFAFDNPKLNMITGGSWEISIYPHCPYKILPKEILFIYFIKFGEDLLQCEIIQHENDTFTYIHKKTTPLKDEDKDLIYTTEYNPKPNFKRKITKITSALDKKIITFYVNDKVFYQDNEIGEIVRNYLQWCKSDKIV